MSYRDTDQSEHGLRLLSIDGGGIRGLSSLLILREILYRMCQARNLPEMPRPCDVFNLAGGTSMGGLIVIMLFRLGMSIEDAIDAYTVLAKQVFSEKKRLLLREEMFKATLLEETVIGIIQTELKLGKDQAKGVRMLDEKMVKCFVCAMPAGHIAHPTLFRSWRASKNSTFNCTVVEAVRATSADPTLFKGIDIGEKNLKERYLDGGLRCNNPVRYVLQEAQSVFPDRPISCIVSIGTGTANVISLQKSDTFRKLLPMKLIDVLKRIATDCENTSEETANQSPSMQNVYFRLNVDQGLQVVSLAEWERLGEVKTHTEQYLHRHDVNRKVSRLIEVLNKPRETKVSVMKATNIPPTTELPPAERQAFDKLENSITVSAYYDSRALSMLPVCLPGTRKSQIETILHWIETDSQKKPLFVVLGPAGSGKSSLLVTIAQICHTRGYFAGSFFFSGTDSDRNSEARLANTIAYQIAIAIPEFQPYIARMVAADSAILSPSRSFQSQMRSLLLQPFSQFRLDNPGFLLQPRVVIIDALDECGNEKDQLQVLETLSEALFRESFPFLCILSSRFDLHIENAMSHKRTRPLIHDRVILGEASDAEMADIRSYLKAEVARIQEEHPFRMRIPDGWPADSDLETIVDQSGGQFIYAATVVRYIDSPGHKPQDRLRYILSVDSSPKAVDPFAALDKLYRTLMSSIESEYLTVAIEILGIELVRKSSQFWTPETLEWENFFTKHFNSLDADIVLAPLAPVLRCENNVIVFYHLTFAEFLLNVTRSGEFFVHPSTRHMWIVSQLVPFFCDNDDIYDTDIEYLIKEAKPGTELDLAIGAGFESIGHMHHLVRGKFNLWPFATYAFLRYLQCRISVLDIADIFAQRGENFLPLPVLIKLAPVCKLSNSFLLFELCRTCAELKNTGLINDYSYTIIPHRLLLFMSYLSEFLDDQNYPERYHLPEDYASATLRCLWYLQSPSHDIRFSLKQQLRSLKELPLDFGIPGYLGDTSNNIAHGALEVFPSLLLRSPPSADLCITLKQSFDEEVTLRTPSSSHKARNSIHRYLLQHDDKYQQCYNLPTEETDVGNDEFQSDFYTFLHLDSTSWDLPTHNWSDSDDESAESTAFPTDITDDHAASRFERGSH